MIIESTIYLLKFTPRFNNHSLINLFRQPLRLLHNGYLNKINSRPKSLTLREIFGAKKKTNRYGGKILLGMSFFGPSLPTSRIHEKSRVVESHNELMAKNSLKPLTRFDLGYLLKLLFLSYEYFRVCLRGLRLTLTFAPILMVYPVCYLGSGFEDIWWKIFVKAIEFSGPICTKFGQWASTRRDLFSDLCCLHLSRLQRRTRPHSWYYTKCRLAKAFGLNWRKIFVKFDNDSQPVGSGCVAQVYKVWMNKDAIEDKSILEEINFDQEDDDESTITLLADGFEVLGFNLWSSFGTVRKRDEEKALEAWRLTKTSPGRDNNLQQDASGIHGVTSDLAHELLPINAQVEETSAGDVSLVASTMDDNTDGQGTTEQHALVEQWQQEPDSLEKYLPSTVDQPEDMEGLVPVAIKVMHPGVYAVFRRDLAFFQFGAYLLDYLFPPLQWISLPTCVEEFSKIMSDQIDLRIEASNLEKFSDHFADVNCVKFPKPLRPYVSRSVLVETYEEGEPMLNFITSDKSEAVKKNLAQYGVDMLLKMIFEDNFVHGDLHPGNILVQNVFEDDEETTDGNQSKLMMVDVGCDIFVMDVQPDPKPMRICILDCGIVAALRPLDLENLKAVFTQVVLGDGRSVANLFLNNSENNCKNREEFRQQMTELVDMARNNLVSMGQVDVGLLLQQLLSLLMRHQIRLEGAMSSVVVSVFILEGLGRSLDPQMDILQRARPLLVTGM